MSLEKLKEQFCETCIIILATVYVLGGPVTFVWLIYTDAQSQHSFLMWCMLLIIDTVLASLWPGYWIFQFIQYLIP